MDRLCPTLLAVFSLWIVLDGCTGQNLEGAWRGPYPFDGANDCRVRMVNSGRFDLSCRDGSDWVGLGTYDRTESGLRFNFTALTHHGEVVPQPPVVEMRLIGEGNTLRLSMDNGSTYVWKRIPP